MVIIVYVVGHKMDLWLCWMLENQKKYWQKCLDGRARWVIVVELLGGVLEMKNVLLHLNLSDDKSKVDDNPWGIIVLIKVKKSK